MALGAMLLDTVAMKINKIIIRNLFHRYNYELELINNNKTSVIYGYNGFGKTTILKIITAILNFDYELLDKIIFDEVVIVFSNFDVSKELKVINVNSDNIKFRYIYDKENYDVKFQKTEIISKISGKKKVLKNYIDNPNLKDIFNKDLIQTAYYISADRIYRYYDGNFGKNLSSCIKQAQHDINSTISSIYSNARDSYLLTRNTKIVPREELIKTSRMIGALRKNGWINRLIVSETNIDLIDSICNKNINELSYKEEKFLNKWYQRISGLFDNPKFMIVELFINILNDNFFGIGNKRVGIDGHRIKMIYFNDDFPYFPIKVKDNDNIPLDSLSSAEKNLFVLFYELIFKLKERKLVMIDEPEISLHIYAQERILDVIDSIVNYDIDSINNYFKKNTGLSQKDFKRRIVNDFVPLYGVQVLIATHSPNICKNHEENMIELKSLQ